MSHHQGEGETAGVLHLLVAVVLTVALPLLPMVLSWIKFFNN